MTEALNRGWKNRDSRLPALLQLERCGLKVEVDPRRIQEVLDRDLLHDAGLSVDKRTCRPNVVLLASGSTAPAGQNFPTDLTQGLLWSVRLLSAKRSHCRMQGSSRLSSYPSGQSP